MLLNLVSLLARGHDHFDLNDLRNKIVLALKNNLDKKKSMCTWNL